MVATHADGEFWHAAEVTNRTRAEQGAGVCASTLTMSVTGASRVVTYPAFAGVAPSTLGVLTPFSVAASTATHDAGDAAGARIDIGVYDTSDAAVKIVKGVATEESGDVEEAPMPALTSDQIMLWRTRIEANASVVATTGIVGRAIEVRTQVQQVTADFTKNNSAAMGNVTGCRFAIGASQTWVFDFYLPALIGATPDIKVAFTVPAGASGTGDAGKIDATGLVWQRVADWTSAQVLASAAAGAALRGSGRIVNSTTPGIVQLQAAQNAATVEDTILYAGGFIVARKVA